MTDARPIRVTALIDTYNYAHFIDEAIESVLAQEFPPEQMEILVVDDGSGDDTAERVRKYGAPVQFFSKPNGGQASTLNFGIARARGEIVAFLDGDDYWLPCKLRRVLAEFDKQPDAGMVYHNFYYKQDDSPDRLRESGFVGVSGFLGDGSKSLLDYTLHPTATLAFRRSVLERLLPIPESLVVQADGYLSCCVVFAAPIIYIDEPLTVYRVHSGNLWNWTGNTPVESNVFEGDAAAKARLERRVAATRAVGEGVRQWLVKNGFDVNRADIRAFLARWAMCSRAEEFALQPPGRVRFFRHLLEESRYFGTRMTWRHRAVHYASALGSLVVGYRNFPRLDEWRRAVKRGLRSAAGGR